MARWDPSPVSCIPRFTALQEDPSSMPPPTNSSCVPLRCTANQLSASANATRLFLLSQWSNLVVLVSVIV